MDMETQLEFLSSLSQAEVFSLLYDWEFWARPEQREPLVPWTIWLIMTGRGFGKTMTGAQTVRRKVEKGRAKHIALVGPTAADVRDVMVGLDPDSSGLMQICPPWNRPTYMPSYRHAVWPNGATATMYSGEEPNRLRGPQHDLAWGDEPAAWAKPDDMLSNLLFGLRRGDAQLILTGTPRPIPMIRGLVKNPDVILTKGSMYDNPMLTDTAVARIKKQYEGTRLGRQEIEGVLLEDNPDALWSVEMIDADRMTMEEFAEKVTKGFINIRRTVVSVDPAVTAKKNSNATGINVACIDDQHPPHAYILRDATMVSRPEAWATVSVALYKEYQADRLIAEVNNGGDLVEATIRQIDPNVSYKDVRATKGKMLRAEPASALYEKHRVHHVGAFPELEDEMLTYDGSQDSPDRLDSLVWSLFALILENEETGAEEAIAYLERRTAICPSCATRTYAPAGQSFVSCRGCAKLVLTASGATSGATDPASNPAGDGSVAIAARTDAVLSAVTHRNPFNVPAIETAS